MHGTMSLKSSCICFPISHRACIRSHLTPYSQFYFHWSYIDGFLLQHHSPFNGDFGVCWNIEHLKDLTCLNPVSCKYRSVSCINYCKYCRKLILKLWTVCLIAHPVLFSATLWDYNMVSETKGMRSVHTISYFKCTVVCLIGTEYSY